MSVTGALSAKKIWGCSMAVVGASSVGARTVKYSPYFAVWNHSSVDTPVTDLM